MYQRQAHPLSLTVTLIREFVNIVSKCLAIDLIRLNSGPMKAATGGF